MPKVTAVSELMCDKCSFTIHYQKLPDRDFVSSQLEGMLKCSLGSNYFRKPYKRGIKIYEPDQNNKLRMLIQWSPIFESVAYLRVDFNPAYADSNHIFATLIGVLPGGLDDIRSHGVITRFDATVDVTGIKPHQLLAYYPKKRISEVHCKSGEIETLYLGEAGGNNRIVIYDKQLQIKEKNQKFGLKLPELKKHTTRIEIRMKPECTFKELLAIENPFDKLMLRVEFEHYEKEELWRLFMVAARFLGLQDALYQLDDHTRKKFRERVEATPNAWWKPKEIWNDWSKVVHLICEPLNSKSWATEIIGAINCTKSSM